MSGRTPERDPAGVGDAGPALAGQNGRVGDSRSVTDVAADEAEQAAAKKAEDAASVEAAIAELWREFKETADQRLRERLILHYSPLVKYVAGRVGVGLPPNIEQADLVSYGIFGLIDAIEKFDISRAIKFETYAI
jgi:RNA polymerase sigma factor for flagellar operon FliA